MRSASAPRLPVPASSSATGSSTRMRVPPARSSAASWTATPRATLVLPTPAGPTSTGQLAWRFPRISSTCSISGSRPITRSSSERCAARVRLWPRDAKVGKLAGSRPGSSDRPGIDGDASHLQGTDATGSVDGSLAGGSLAGGSLAGGSLAGGPLAGGPLAGGPLSAGRSDGELVGRSAGAGVLLSVGRWGGISGTSTARPAPPPVGRRRPGGRVEPALATGFARASSVGRRLTS